MSYLLPQTLFPAFSQVPIHSGDQLKTGAVLIKTLNGHTSGDSSESHLINAAVYANQRGRHYRGNKLISAPTAAAATAPPRES